MTCVGKLYNNVLSVNVGAYRLRRSCSIKSLNKVTQANHSAVPQPMTDLCSAFRQIRYISDMDHIIWSFEQRNGIIYHRRVTKKLPTGPVEQGLRVRDYNC